MTSFAVSIEPVAQPRLAALVLLAHLLAAAAPWIARCTPALAVPLSVLALAGLAATIARLPGPHCTLCGLALDARSCRARLQQTGAWRPAAIGPGTRAYAALVVLELVTDGRRVGWLLPRGSLPAEEFRRLKALIRLS